MPTKEKSPRSISLKFAIIGGAVIFIVGIVLGVISITLIALAVSKQPQGTNTTSTVDVPKTASQPQESFKDNLLTLKDSTVKITSTKVVPAGQPGNQYGNNPVIIFYYDVNNISSDNLTPGAVWIADFSVYQDTDPNQINQLNVGSLPENETDLNSKLYEQIKVGGTASGVMSYALSDTKTPVKVIASNGIGTNIGVATFNLQN